MDFKMSMLSEKEKYRLLTSSIVPRPIAWVSTTDKQGILNVAPFSYFTSVSIEPPLLLISIERRNEQKKDTLNNITSENEFVVNVVDYPSIKKMNITSGDFLPEENEFVHANITPVQSTDVNPPRIKEAPIQIECRSHQLIEIGSSPHTMVIGEVVTIHVDDKLMANERISMQMLDVVGRMGGKYYTQTNELLEIPRIDFRKNDV